MFQETHETPFGWLTVHCSDIAIIKISWSLKNQENNSHTNHVSRETWKQINNYCIGKTAHFNIPIAPEVSPSLLKWLEVMQKIAPGTTITYKGFANMANKPQAPRSAGSACARNPIPLIVPCHRVLRSDGSLGNYGAIRDISPQDNRNLRIKQALIDHEKQYFSN